MTTYIVGVVVLGAIFAPPARSAVLVRRRLLPGWTGAPAFVVDSLFWAAQVITVPEVLGGVGLFRRVPVVVGMIVVAVGLAMAVRSRPTTSEPGHVPSRAAVTTGAGQIGQRSGSPGGTQGAPGQDGDVLLPRSGESSRRSPRTEGDIPSNLAAGRTETIAAALIGTLLAGPWLVYILSTYRFGSQNFDSLNYHLPFAARWVQTGSTWHVQQVAPGFIVPYHPVAAEVLHALGMLAFHRDLISPLLNLFWLALLAASAWSLGAPRGRGPQSMALALVVANCPLMISSQPATAMTDLAVVATCLAAVALVVQGVSILRVSLPIGVAVGLAIGIKLDALAPMAVLFLGAVILTGRSERIAVTLRIGLSALVVGGFWYLRDLAAVGNPLPGLDLGLLPKVAAPNDQLGGYSVLHYATNVTVIHRYFMAGLSYDFGRLWPLWLAAIALGAVGTLVRAPSPAYRLAAACAIGAVVAYAITPTSAFGPAGAPILFKFNTRYAMVGLVLGAGLLPVIPRLRTPRAGRTLLGLAALFALATLASSVTWPIGPHLVLGWRMLGLLATVAIVSVVVVAARLAQTRQSVLRCMRTKLIVSSLVTLTALAGLVAGYEVQTRTIPHQYTQIAYQSPALGWAWTSLHHARIAYVGVGLNYPLTGSDLNNLVGYVGVARPDHGFDVAPDCQVFRNVVSRGRYDYVIFSTDYRSGHFSPQDAWVRGARGAVPVFTSPYATAYRLTQPLDPSGCGG